MRIAFPIDATKTIPALRDTVPGHRFGLPAVNFGEHRFHVRLAVLIFRVPPIERAQRVVERIARLLRLGDQTQSQLMDEPSFGARVTRGIDCFLTPLQHALCLREGAFLFRVAGGREKENFRLDFFRFQFAAFDLG